MMYLHNGLVVLEGTDNLSFLPDGEPPKSMRLDDLIEYFTRTVAELNASGEVFFAKILEIDLRLLRALEDTDMLVRACSLAPHPFE
jgi:hypothetical protein